MQLSGIYRASFVLLWIGACVSAPSRAEGPVTSAPRNLRFVRGFESRQMRMPGALLPQATDNEVWRQRHASEEHPPTAAPSYAPSIVPSTAEPTQQNTSDNHKDEDAPSFADAALAMGAVAIAFLGRCLASRRQAAREAERSVSGATVEIPPWEELRLADRTAPALDSRCPISMEDFDWQEKPVRIVLNNTTASGSAINLWRRGSAIKGNQARYNNKWYAYDAIVAYIRSKTESGAVFTEPTTRESFTVADLRRAHPSSTTDTLTKRELERVLGSDGPAEASVQAIESDLEMGLN